MNSTAIMEVINQKYEKFTAKHKRPPKYIKLPSEAYRILLREYFGNEFCANMALLEEDEALRIMGMKVCPTFVIENIEDIELF